MIVTSKGILNIKGLAAMVGEPIFYCYDPRIKISMQTYVAGWGRKRSFAVAQSYAKTNQKTVVCLEDGFIRSLGLGKAGVQPLSIVMDYTGIYFDSTQSSDLEKLITQPENHLENQRANHLIEKIKQFGITKYNEIYTPLNNEKFHNQENILVVDQTFGDQSIKYAGASAITFKKMLQQALVEHPLATIWVKIHPDVQAGHAKSHFSSEELQHSRVRICSEAYNPIELLAQMQQVYVVSSQMGFEALMCGKKVSCFGLPWYAGWGVTDDTHAPLEQLKGRRNVKKTIHHLFVCAYLQYARYVSPISHHVCQLEDILDLLIVNKRFQTQFQADYIGYGFSRWKREFITEFLNFPQATLSFNYLLKPRHKQMAVAWGRKARILKKLNHQNVITVEDGFVRSYGLGANLIRPYSLVFDDIGIYYDATTESKLERILNHLILNQVQEKRVENLIQQLIQLNITKYNVGEECKLSRPNASQVLLVTGQVEDDLSIKFGGLHIKTNLELLKKVRENNPQAYIIYKPHPDVHAGLRIGNIATDITLQYANHIELKASILECFEICDEIHTISSLSGFEALLRGLSVFCYGMPFYAGWGLTKDVENCKRRTKNLTLNELVYGVLIEYAMYNLPITKGFYMPLVNIEDIITYLVAEKSKGTSSVALKSTFAKLRATIIKNIIKK